MSSEKASLYLQIATSRYKLYTYSKPFAEAGKHVFYVGEAMILLLRDRLVVNEKSAKQVIIDLIRAGVLVPVTLDLDFVQPCLSAVLRTRDLILVYMDYMSELLRSCNYTEAAIAVTCSNPVLAYAFHMLSGRCMYEKSWAKTTVQEFQTCLLDAAKSLGLDLELKNLTFARLLHLLASFEIVYRRRDSIVFRRAYVDFFKSRTNIVAYAVTRLVYTLLCLANSSLGPQMRLGVTGNGIKLSLDMLTSKLRQQGYLVDECLVRHVLHSLCDRLGVKVLDSDVIIDAACLESVRSLLLDTSLYTMSLPELECRTC